MDNTLPRAATKSRYRHVLAALAYFVLLALVNTLSFRVVGAGLAAVTSEWVATLVESLVYLLGVLALTWAFSRFVDHRSLRDLGLQTRGWLSKLAAGWGLGTILQVIVFSALALAGWLTITRAAWQPVAFVVSVASWTIVSFNEELAFRGYIMQRVADDWGMPVAVVISSAVFAMVHALNPNVQVLAIVSLFVAGLLLACAYLVTRSLWLPIGLHIGWNLAEVNLFGFAGSGIHDPSILHPVMTGPDLMTGGAFGPEGGIVGVVVPLLGIVVLVVGYRIAVAQRKS